MLENIAVNGVSVEQIEHFRDVSNVKDNTKTLINTQKIGKHDLFIFIARV